MAGRDDARGDRAAKPKGVADGDHPIAHAHRFAVAEFHRLEWLVRLHPKHRDIDLFVLANHFGLQFLAIGENDCYFIGVGDDVIVGDDDPGWIDDEAGAERIRFALVLFLFLPVIAALLAALEELLEKIVEGRTRLQLRRILGALVVHGLRRRDIHDGIADRIREIGEGLRSLRAGRAGDGPDAAGGAQDQRATKHEGGSRRGPPPPRAQRKLSNIEEIRENTHENNLLQAAEDRGRPPRPSLKTAPRGSPSNPVLLLIAGKLNSSFSRAP